MIWHDHPDQEWLWECNICDYTQPLVHWLTPGATRRLHIQPDAFGDNPEYIERYDAMSGKNWFQRTVSGTQAPRRSRRKRIYQVAYTNDQYDLIGWAVWAHEEHGWTALEIFRVIERFWSQELGQTPLVSRTVHVWFLNRRNMRAKGLQWP